MMGRTKVTFCTRDKESLKYFRVSRSPSRTDQEWKKVADDVQSRWCFLVE